jgi:hypothetical protein
VRHPVHRRVHAHHRTDGRFGLRGAFTAVYDPADPNRIEGGKRPRSSISPTIVLRHGKPFLALGSPGGSAEAPGTRAAEIGAATAIEFGRHHLLTAVSEPTRRGGGSTLVVRPAP